MAYINSRHEGEKKKKKKNLRALQKFCYWYILLSLCSFLNKDVTMQGCNAVCHYLSLGNFILHDGSKRSFEAKPWYTSPAFYM